MTDNFDERLAEVENKYRDELRRAHAQITDLQKQLQQALMGKVPEHQVADPGAIWIEPIVSHRTGGGKVNLRWGNLSAQLTVKQAREHALGILEAAEAAETDAFLYKHFTENLQATPQMFVAFIQDFRAFRERNRDGK